jgi:2-polyprenyl-6-methoxyphenol hydroxylase-like FAD-dependent oxidoreductase
MTAKEIKLLRQDDEQVEVICGDGTSYTGDILIGADGVYSAVRRLLFLETPGTIPFTACYKGVLGMSMTVPGVEVGAMVEIHFRNLNLQYLATSELTYWFIWTPRETPSRSRTRYTQSELEENVKVCADVPLSPNSKAYFASLWQTKKRAVLADIEEGILKQWYKDRTVLVGDSCHKTNPHLGFGANNCVESAVALANNLRRLQTDVEQQGRANPSIHQIKKAFATYQKERYSRAKWTIDMSAFYAGLSNWNNLLSELVTRHLLPHMGWLIANYLFAPTLRNGIVLEAIGEPHYKTGKVKWKYGKAQIDTSCH